MDLWRIAVRVTFAYVFILILARIAGNRMVKQSDVSSFIVALVIGDMADDLFWSEVPAAQFVVGAATLVIIHIQVGIQMLHSGSRIWRHARH